MVTLHYCKFQPGVHLGLPQSTSVLASGIQFCVHSFLFQEQQCYPGEEVPLIAPPSLDRRPTVSSVHVEADYNSLSFPPMSDEQFLAEYREASKPKVVLIGEKEVPVLGPVFSGNSPLDAPMGFSPPGDWLTAHLNNEKVLQKYLHELQRKTAVGGGYFLEKAMKTGKKAFEAFLEAGSAVLTKRFSVDRRGLDLGELEDLSTLISALHMSVCRDMGRKKRLRKDLQLAGGQKDEGAQPEELSLGSIEDLLGCGVTKPSGNVWLGSGGRASSKVLFPPNLFHRLDSFLQKLRAKQTKQNKIFNRFKIGDGVLYSIFDKDVARTVFLALGVSEPLFQFKSKKGFPLQGLIDRSHPLTVRYSGPKENIVRMHLYFRSGGAALP